MQIGEKVTKGQPMARIEKLPLQVELVTAEADLIQARAAYQRDLKAADDAAEQQRKQKEEEKKQKEKKQKEKASTAERPAPRPTAVHRRPSRNRNLPSPAARHRGPAAAARPPCSS